MVTKRKPAGDVLCNWLHGEDHCSGERHDVSNHHQIKRLFDSVFILILLALWGWWPADSWWEEFSSNRRNHKGARYTESISISWRYHAIPAQSVCPDENWTTFRLAFWKSCFITSAELSGNCQYQQSIYFSWKNKTNSKCCFTYQWAVCRYIADCYLHKNQW